LKGFEEFVIKKNKGVKKMELEPINNQRKVNGVRLAGNLITDINKVEWQKRKRGENPEITKNELMKILNKRR